jgi:TrmH family RNA methyltransferase
MEPIRKIISRDNEQLKFARRVRDGREKDKIFLEGVRLVGEAAKSRTQCESVFVSTEFLDQLPADDIAAWLRPRNIFEVSDQAIHTLADTKNAQGIIVIAERPDTGPNRIERVAVASPPLVVFLFEINNPSNLGAVIRSAEAAGVAGVIVSNDSADAFSPKSLRAAMGSSLRLPIWTGATFDEAIAWACANKLRTVAADVKGTKSYADVDWQIPRMLVLGSEAHGLDERDLARIDELIVVPIEKEVESLNLAVAAGVIMFEARRQSSIR